MPFNLNSSCFSRELTGRFTSPPSRSSLTSALKPTSPRHPTTSSSVRWWMSSNQGNLWQRFSSIRYLKTHSAPWISIPHARFRKFNLPLSLYAELQMSQRFLFGSEAGGLSSARPPARSLQRLQLPLHKLRQEPPAEPTELNLPDEEA